MKIIIDEKVIEIRPEDKNIIDVTDRAKINIPAPCYRSKRSKGCCHVCLVEINGKHEYACVTKPLDGMNIIFNREDLNKIRKERIREYQESPKDVSKGYSCNCDCSGTSNNCC
ncbi:MAG: 2Fe-2S iron-sulfur cluster-binding protein [Candidatus Aminicenantaceae bacterium]